MVSEKQIRRYKKTLSKSGGFDKLPQTAQAGIYAWQRIGNKKKKKR